MYTHARASARTSNNTILLKKQTFLQHKCKIKLLRKTICKIIVHKFYLIMILFMTKINYIV